MERRKPILIYCPFLVQLNKFYTYTMIYYSSNEAQLLSWVWIYRNDVNKNAHEQRKMEDLKGIYCTYTTILREGFSGQHGCDELISNLNLREVLPIL